MSNMSNISVKYIMAENSESSSKVWENLISCLSQGLLFGVQVLCIWEKRASVLPSQSFLISLAPFISSSSCAFTLLNTLWLALVHLFGFPTWRKFLKKEVVYHLSNLFGGKGYILKHNRAKIVSHFLSGHVVLVKSGKCQVLKKGARNVS